MKLASHLFPEKAKEALHDQNLQKALGLLQVGFPELRRRAIANLPDFEALRDQAATIKDHSLKNLDKLTSAFTEKIESRGGQVHMCATAEDARKAVVKICQEVEAIKITKSKSMVTEEISLNEAIEAAGMEVVETDLGEYILQLAGEPPSHIVGPALHKTRQQVVDLFKKHHDIPLKSESGEGLVAQAREVLRAKYFEADVGITGANFLIAETGTVVIVTNEGNADLCRVLPKTHIVVTSLEKVIPTLDDLSVFLKLLGRSATGQDITVYTTLVSGPKDSDESGGPENFHVVIVDGGRSKLLGTDQQDLLRCIKCGACMNHCPVYSAVGGQAYGWVYPGPIGAALNPALTNPWEMRHLHQASTFCGACEAVCPVKIPLIKMFRFWRTQSFDDHITGRGQRFSLRLWAYFASRPRLYAMKAYFVLPLLKIMAGKKGYLGHLPFLGGWFRGRVLPGPEGKRFVGEDRK